MKWSGNDITLCFHDCYLCFLVVAPQEVEQDSELNLPVINLPPTTPRQPLSGMYIGRWSTSLFHTPIIVKILEIVGLSLLAMMFLQKMQNR